MTSLFTSQKSSLWIIHVYINDHQLFMTLWFMYIHRNYIWLLLVFFGIPSRLRQRLALAGAGSFDPKLDSDRGPPSRLQESGLGKCLFLILFGGLWTSLVDLVDLVDLCICWRLYIYPQLLMYIYIYNLYNYIFKQIYRTLDILCLYKHSLWKQ